jgi:hypothetical protein
MSLRQGREGLANYDAKMPSNFMSATQPTKVGQVVGIIMGENLPTPTQYQKAGGNDSIGSILYLEVNTNGPINISGSYDDTLYNTCKVAKPFSSTNIYCPLVGELVYIIEDFPSANSEIDNTAIKTYYLGVINVWGSTQLNSVNNSNPGITYKQNPKIKNLLPFEGDHIIQGRQGSALRFSSTTKLYNDLNEWSEIGSDDDPITILTNGYDFNSNIKTYVSNINKDLSSIYLTSAQKLPLETDRTGTLNPLTNPIDASEYFNAQVIINSDRVVLNSKRDEVMIFAKSNIELNTKNIINLNANERVHLNSNTVFLGTVNNQLPTEPLVLGDKLNTILENLLDSLYSFGASLSTVVGSPEGAPAMDINAAAESLLNDIDRINNNLEGILSQQNFTA